MKNKAEQIKHSEEYLAFLEKRLNSKNFRANASKEEFEKTKQKRDKEKMILKILKGTP